LCMQMLMHRGDEGGSYEERENTKHLSRRSETMPGATAGIGGAESLDETVHYL
jgi:hypothetical protein